MCVGKVKGNDYQSERVSVEGTVHIEQTVFVMVKGHVESAA